MSSGETINVANGTTDMQMSLDQLNSELFAINNEEIISNELVSNQEIINNELYVETKELRNHIENAERTISGRAGIKGAHNKNNFLAEVNRIGAKIDKIEKNTQFQGVEKITYQMPKRDAKGNPTGEFQSAKRTKTVYDPNVISTDNYIKWGLEAANNTAKSSSSGKLNREWNGTDNQGKRWHGYCDNSGNITSFYPED